MPTRWICDSSSPGARSTTCVCSLCAGPTSSVSPATSRLAAVLARRSLAGCAPSSASTATPSRRVCWNAPQQPMSGRPRLDYESHATGLDRNDVGALLVTAGLASARELSYRCWPSTGSESPKLSAPTSKHSAPSAGIAPSPCSARAARSSRSHWPRVPPGRSTSRSVSASRDRSSSAATAHDSTVTPPGGSCGASPAVPGSTSRSGRIPCATRSSSLVSMPECPSATSKKPRATPTREPQCDMTGRGSRSTGDLRGHRVRRRRRPMIEIS